MTDSKRARGPDFLGIGAQKAGTTWIYDQLVHHPQVWLPVIKELHYFNFAVPHPALAGVEEYPWGGPLSRFRFLRDRPTWETLLWLLRYNYLPKSAAWYRSLFPARTSKIKGEITPAYSTLDEDGVKLVHETVPSHCKVFMVLRNPVDRAWSGLKMNYRWRAERLDASSPGLLSDLCSPTNLVRSEYARIVPLWERHFGDRFRVFFYDDLVADAEAFLADVCRYLGLDAGWKSPALSMRSNSDAEKIPMPQELYSRLYDAMREDIAFVEQRYPDRGRKWRVPMETR